MVILETGLSRPDAPSPHKRLGFGYRLASPGLWANFKMDRGLVVRGPSCRHQLSPIADELVTGRVLLGFS